MKKKKNNNNNNLSLSRASNTHIRRRLSIGTELGIHILTLIDSFVFYFQAPYRCVVSSELKNDVISIPVLTLSRPVHKVRRIHD